MRCIVLLSGGKDSVAAVDVARGWGWDVVGAVVMVSNADDAWMFHVPNIALAPAVAACLDLPVIEAPCSTDPEEEVAALEAAIAEAAAQFSADAVISGALASEYQRTRIDAIGQNLGLRTFAPLWHIEPEAYMRGLAAAGYDVRIVRAAADGMGPEWAGRTLDGKAIDELVAMPTRPHVAGEGGEFETLVLDGPGYTQCIVIDDAETEATASRSTYHIRKWHLAPRPSR